MKFFQLLRQNFMYFLKGLQWVSNHYSISFRNISQSTATLLSLNVNICVHQKVHPM